MSTKSDAGVLPEDMHAHVLTLVTQLVETTEVGDRRAHWRLYGELRSYCESESASGREHPFLWETLADFTTESRVAIEFYARALAQAERLGATEYEASIRFALAEQHLKLGSTELAYRYALAANEQSKQLDDPDLRRDISQFLLEQAPATS